MNNISLNESVDLWDMLMFQIGSTWVLDSLYIYLNTSIGLLGAILNILSLFVLFRINENQAFYTYMKILTTNGIIVCIILFSYSFSRSPRYLSFAFSLGPSLIRCYITTSFTVLVQFGNSMNIFILFERIAYFKPRLKRIFKENVFMLSFIAFLASILVNLPAFFLNETRNQSEFEMALTDYKKVQVTDFCRRSSFSKTLYGSILLLMSSFIKDFLFLLVEIILTLISVYYIKEFFKKKTVISTISNSSITKTVTSQAVSIQSNDNLLNSSIISNFKVLSKEHKLNKSYLAKHRKRNKIVSIMSLFLETFSIASNLASILTALALLIFNNRIMYHQLVFICLFLVIFKYFANFFILFLFNKKFRQYLLQLKIVSISFNTSSGKK